MHPAGCGVNSWESDRSRLYYQADPTIGLGSAISVELPGRPEKGFVVSDQQTSCYKRTLNVWGGGLLMDLPFVFRSNLPFQRRKIS